MRAERLMALLAAATLAACDASSPDPTGTIGTWTLAAPLIEPRCSHSMTPLPGGKVLVAGGFRSISPEGNGAGLDSAELYDPATGLWTPTGRMVSPRFWHAAELLDDGRVLVAGGFVRWVGEELGIFGVALSSAELYDPATGEWTATGAMRSARYGPGVLLPNGKVLVVGSRAGDSYASLTIGGESELYDPASGTWEASGPMVRARAAPGMVLLPSGLVLAAGGSGLPPGTLTATAELYDPTSRTWRSTASLGYPVEDHSMTVLPTGEVLLACGRLDEYMPSGTPPRSTAQLYDPATETWRDTSPMTYPRAVAPAVRLASGHVLLSGGNFFDFAQDGAGYYPAPGGDVYDPWLDTWTPTPAMPHYVGYTSTAVLLPDGDVLSAGGNLYDGLGFGWEDLISISAAQRFRWARPAASPEPPTPGSE
jgi:Galactose oxidase, central domain/Kelch motif